MESKGLTGSMSCDEYTWDSIMIQHVKAEVTHDGPFPSQSSAINEYIPLLDHEDIVM